MRKRIPRQKEAAAAPVSFVQQRLWIFDQLEPELPVFHRPSRLRLRGLVDVQILTRVLAEIARRHEILRTIFVQQEGTPHQIVLAPQPLRLRCEDVSDVAAADREARLQEWEREDSRPFDLSRGPLFRARLVRFGDFDHLLLWNVHHIVFDAWSMGLLLNEIEVLHEAFAALKPSPLPEPTIQYSDFAHWQRSWLNDPALQRQLAYWRQTLSGAPDRFDLPFDRPRPERASYRGAAEDLEVGPEVTAGFKSLARREGATLFMASLAALEVLLSRYTGREDFLIGIPIAGRSHIETEDLIGCFINTLVLRADLSGDPTFRQLLARVRRTTLEAYSNQDVPVEKVVEELRPSRSLSHAPLFQVMSNFRNVPRRLTSGGQLRVEVENRPSQIALVDLALELAEGQRGLVARFTYSTDLFDSSSVCRIAEHFRTLIRGAVENPDRPVGNLPLLAVREGDRAQALWNETDRNYPDDRCVHELFEDQVARVPDRPAVSFEGRSMTYAELNARANRLARRLRREGVGPEVPVGVCFEPSVEMLVALLAVWKAGGAWVALDPAWPRERLAFVATDSGCVLLLTGSDPPEALAQIGTRSFRVGVEIESGGESGNLPPVGDGSRLAYILYTSGSTGAPKGVAVEHRSIVNYLLWVNETLFAQESLPMPVVSRLAFDASLKQLFAPLLRGDAVWILPEEVASRPDLLRRALSSAGPVALNCVPALWSALLQDLRDSRAETSLLGLRALFLGGERLPPELVAETFSALPQLEIWNLYGPTEATANATAARIRSAADVPIGRPIANARAYVLDEMKQLVPAGVAGELFIGGEGVARGYWKREELTRERFLSDPFRGDPAARMYRTGDLARQRPDGTLEFLGRIDDQVKIRGFRIELGEIEAALLSHPLVREAAAAAREDILGDRALVAYFVPAPGAAPPISELRRFLREKLPDHMVPSAFLSLGHLPRTPNGKVDRHSLPPPDRREGGAERVYVAPRNPTEEIVAGIWAQVLRMERVGIRDNFFELGGHSLLATQVFSRLRETFQVDLPIRILFETPTIAELCASIERFRGSGGDLKSSPIHPVSRALLRKQSWARHTRRPAGNG